MVISFTWSLHARAPEIHTIRKSNEATRRDWIFRGVMGVYENLKYRKITPFHFRTLYTIQGIISFPNYEIESPGYKQV